MNTSTQSQRTPRSDAFAKAGAGKALLNGALSADDEESLPPHYAFRAGMRPRGTVAALAARFEKQAEEDPAPAPRATAPPGGVPEAFWIPYSSIHIHVPLVLGNYTRTCLLEIYAEASTIIRRN